MSSRPPRGFSTRLDLAGMDTGSAEIPVPGMFSFEGDMVRTGFRLGLAGGGVEAIIRSVPGERVGEPSPGLGYWAHKNAPARPAAPVPPEDKCLDEFIRLESADAEAILRFANRWGTLWICSHGKPCNHQIGCKPMNSLDEKTGELVVWEPIASWRLFIVQARAILDSAARIFDGGQPSAELAKTVRRGYKVPGLSADGFTVGTGLRDTPEHSFLQMSFTTGETPRDPWQLVARLVDNWVRYGGVRLQFMGHESTKRFSMRGETGAGVFALLALRLAAALCSPNGVHHCDECGNPYVPRKRRPRSGVAKYCLSCSAGTSRASKRRSAQRMRERKRAEEAARTEREADQ